MTEKMSRLASDIKKNPKMIHIQAQTQHSHEETEPCQLMYFYVFACAPVGNRARGASLKKVIPTVLSCEVFLAITLVKTLEDNFTLTQPGSSIPP